MFKNFVVLMATKKERIQNLEARLGGLQDGMQQMEIGINEKLHQLEETINRMSDAFFQTKKGPAITSIITLVILTRRIPRRKLVEAE